MSRPQPVNRERTFEFNELFFSTTDLRGIIQFGNEVFFRIAGYDAEKAVGAPHNLIRHPDMPKVVFKLLWDTIQSGKMIAAYVKNMAIDGSFYWVLAVVFPVGDKYLSIRLKPSSALFQAAQQIYVDALRVEKESGVEASGQVIFSALEKAGFKSYDQFMIAALKAEIQARDQVLLASPKRATDLGSSHGAVSEISKVSTSASDLYRSTFEQIKRFENVNAIFRKTTDALFEEMLEFRLVSLNMRVLASQVGHEGASLAVVTENFQQLVATLEDRLRTFSGAVTEVCDKMDRTGLDIIALKVQMDMVDFFVRESLGQAASGAVSLADAFGPLEQNSGNFLELSRKYTKEIEQQMFALAHSLDSFTAEYQEMRKFLNGIELISQIGAVEAARMKDSKFDFGHYISRMRDFATLLRSSIQELGNTTGGLGDSLRDIKESLGEASPCTAEIFRLAFDSHQAAQKKAAA